MYKLICDDKKQETQGELRQGHALLLYTTPLDKPTLCWQNRSGHVTTTLPMPKIQPMRASCSRKYSDTHSLSKRHLRRSSTLLEVQLDLIFVGSHWTGQQFDEVIEHWRDPGTIGKQLLPGKSFYNKAQKPLHSCPVSSLHTDQIVSLV
jgi:hypothetical protein